MYRYKKEQIDSETNISTSYSKNRFIVNPAKNRFIAKPVVYEFPGSNGLRSHELIPDTIAVHKLKNNERWFQVLTYFNVTSAVNESKLYHL